LTVAASGFPDLRVAPSVALKRAFDFEMVLCNIEV